MVNGAPCPFAFDVAAAAKTTGQDRSVTPGDPPTGRCTVAAEPTRSHCRVEDDTFPEPPSDGAPARTR
jgi:hypothetical protein